MNSKSHGFTWLPSQFSKKSRTGNEKSDQCNNLKRRFISPFKVMQNIKSNWKHYSADKETLAIKQI
jgi:hypothetical protein